MTYGYGLSQRPQAAHSENARVQVAEKQPEAIIAAQELSNSINLLVQSVDILEARLQDVMENAPETNGLCGHPVPEMLSPIGRAMMEKAQQVSGLNERLQYVIKRLAI